MLTKAKIEAFYEDVDRLGLKFPGAAIARATGYSKGNVSQYLTKTLVPSEAFLNVFYKEFGESLKNVPREVVPAPNRNPQPTQGGDYLPEYLQSLLEQKRILEEQNQFLRRNFEVSLSSIAEVQQVEIAHLKALAWYSASVQSGENDQKTNKELVKINTRIGEYLQASVKKDS